MKAQDIIQLLNLKPLPDEGGLFRQTYIASETIPQAALPPRYHSDLAFGTVIYFLLVPDEASAMHRLITDEMYHFYLGDPVEMLLLHPDGSGEVFTLGQNLQAGMRPQKLVPHGVWQGSRVLPGGAHGFALLGTSMCPAFDVQGFELGQREVLMAQYPDFAAQITARTR